MELSPLTYFLLFLSGIAGGFLIIKLYYIQFMIIFYKDDTNLGLDMNYFNELAKIKPEFLKDGFKIVGLFGSAARNELTDNSDIDILYDLEPIFLERHKGFGAIRRLVEIKEYLAKIFSRKVDIVDIKTLSKTSEKYIMQEIRYV